MKELFLDDLVHQQLPFVAQRWILDRVPHIFNDDHVAHVRWKCDLAKSLGVDGRSIVVVGSAGTGFSLNPNKSYKQFDGDSDVDVAVVSEHHFNMAWHAIRNLGIKRFDLDRVQSSSLIDHVNRLIYWGTFDARSLLSHLPFGKQWLTAFDQVATQDPTRDRLIGARIYRDFDSLSAYHVNNLRGLLNKQIRPDQ